MTNEKIAMLGLAQDGSGGASTAVDVGMDRACGGEGEDVAGVAGGEV
jgi:hypothetical protein